jgi:hypothetical protein
MVTRTNILRGQEKYTQINPLPSTGIKILAACIDHTPNRSIIMITANQTPDLKRSTQPSPVFPLSCSMVDNYAWLVRPLLGPVGVSQSFGVSRAAASKVMKMPSSLGIWSVIAGPYTAIITLTG